MRAIALLSGMKLRNSLQTLFTDPRKLIPFLILVVFVGSYAALVMFGLGKAARAPGHSAIMLPPGVFEACAFLTLVFICLTSIDSGLGDSLLAFAMPDVDYVFPSPISRRVVLAYKLPSLTINSFFTGIFILFMLNVCRMIFGGATGGADTSPGWAPPLAMFLCIGTSINLAMFISVSVQDRKLYHRILLTIAILLVASIAFVAWRSGIAGIVQMATSPILRWPFFPASPAATIVSHAGNVGGSIGLLLLYYGLSLIPMFLSNANFYEQSIVSTERVTKLRQAAKGGFASLSAANAEKIKKKSFRAYTVSPFGSGATALFWAHVCAAAKKPFSNFVAPLILGIAIGTCCAFVVAQFDPKGYGVLVFIALYAGMFFMGTAKTACENAIRRRELLSPLPVPTWAAVAANLGVPMVAVVLFGIGSALPLAILQVPQWPSAFIAMAIVYPTLIGVRMLVQYIIGIAYPDVSDKVQQFMSMIVVQLASGPFIIGEALLCIPGVLLKSPLFTVLGVLLFDAPMLVLLLLLAGKITDKVVATGERVNLWQTVTRRG